MYNIIKEQNETFNGLGGTNAPNTKTAKTGEAFSNVANSITNAANSVANITNAFANLHNANNSGNNGGQPVYVYNGGQNTASGTGQTNTEKDKGMSDYLPWIIGGGVLLVGLVLMNKKK